MEKDRIFPDNWKELVRGKKVILYNTGVSGLLHEREKQLEKMRWVFQVFREYPEVVLWWRPHPLELSTLQSMLPELEEQYMEVRQQYIEENIGILDESADLNRAIAISDAYYGAYSSVAELYKAAKKPVLYETNSVKSKGTTVFVPVALCVKGESIWFIQSDSNKLIRMNQETSEIEKVVTVSCEPPFRNRLYYQIIDIGTSILLLFGDSEKIYEYEIEEDNIRIHNLQNENFAFYSEAVLSQNDKLLMFPYDSCDIQEYYYCDYSVIRKKFADRKIKIAKCYEVVGSKAYVVDKGSNTLYKFDLEKSVATAVHVGKEGNKYWGVKKAGSYFVLPHIDKKVITLWNEETGEVGELSEFPEKYTCMEGWAYFDMFERAGQLYIFPAYANMILEIDVENRTVKQVFAETSFEADYDAKSEFFSGRTYVYTGKNQQNIYAYSLYKKCWQIFDLDAMEMQEKSMFGIKRDEHRILLETLLDDGTSGESFCEWERVEICTLENYINNLICHFVRNSGKELHEDDIGRDIHKTLMQELSN